jgi:hypothetical protein
MSKRIGSGFIGSDSLKVSSVMEEVVPLPPASKPFKRYSLYQFSFLNHDADCTVVINEDATIFLRAGQGFESDSEDMPIYSFVVKESGITYNWIAAFY